MRALIAAVFMLMVCSTSGTASQAQDASGSAATATDDGSTMAGAPYVGRAQLLTGTENWGLPPASDYAEAALPEPPPFAGWRRTFGANGNCTILGANNGMLLVNPGTGVLAYDLVSGELRWRYIEQGDNWLDQAWFEGGRAFIPCGGPGLIALNVADGKLLWRENSCNLLAVGASGIWVERKHPESDFETLGTVALLNASTGQELHSFDSGDCSKPYWLAPEASDYYAIKRNDAICMLLPSGAESILPSPRPEWAAEFAYNQDWLLVGEYPDLDSWDFPSSQEYLDRAQAALIDPVTGQPGAGFILSCYAVSSGALHWRREFTKPEGDSFYPSGLECIGDTVYVNDISGVIATISLADGKDAPNLCIDMAEMTSGNIAQDGSRLYYLSAATASSDEALAYGYSLRMSDLETKVTREVFAANGNWFAPGVFVSDGYLIGSTSTGGGTGYASTPVLLAIALGQDGLPSAGQMRLLTQREEHQQLVEAFLACPDPLADTELMRTIITTGVNAIERCVTKLKPDQASHWDALLAAAMYLRTHKSEDQYGMDAIDLLWGMLRENAQPAYTPQVIRWFHDPSLASIRNALAGSLAACGGPLAKTQLDAYYAELDITQHKAPQAGALVNQPEIAGIVDPTRYDDLYVASGLWAEANSGNGVKYALFPAAGLISDRDLYVAIDSQGDGVWDEVLPTGLRDMCFSHCHPGGPIGPGPKGMLEFKVEQDVLKIMHHQPVYEMVTYDEGPDQWEREELTGADRVETTVKMADLRLDSDADGLTDVLEKLLFLDSATADTDGDGVADDLDVAPRANPAQMGKLERGIARALRFFVTGNEDSSWWLGSLERTGYERVRAGQPWSARYILARECGPISFSGGINTFGICLNTKEQRAAYATALKGYPSMSALEIGWSTPNMDAIQAWKCSVYSDSFPGPDATESGNYMYANDWKQSATRNADMIVNIEFWLSGYVVAMIEIDGEYYPREMFMTWIS